MLDLKAKLAAAGVVSAKQVKDFDEKEAKAKDSKRRKAANPKKHHEPRKHKGAKPQSSNKRSGARKKKPGTSKTATDAATLKTLNRGEAYGRIRKVVEHSRLDDKEQTIPGVDDQTFNFVTAQGRIGKLYVTAATAQKLSEGKAGISAFMSHHGLSHCVLPRDIALDFAQVFPLWLRHLQGHEAAGQIEAPPEEAEPLVTESDSGPSSDKEDSESSSDTTESESPSDKADSESSSDTTKSESPLDKADSESSSDTTKSETPLDKASGESSQDKANS